MPEQMTLPALRQSMVEVASCPVAYREIFINGHTQADSIPSERGTEIHRVMSQYVDHCAKQRVASDWRFFNSLTKTAGPEAGPILDGIRDNYEVDWQRVYGTEVTLSLDEDLDPYPLRPIAPHSLWEPAHTGTLDVILLSPDGTRAKIDDYKSHPSPFDADTYQSLLYSFMLFKHLPALDSVKFELNFVRYRNCLRSVTWRREQMPEMQDAISRARERQRITHANPEEAQALPCKTCTYCPLMKDLTCPIADSNEYAALAPPLRLIQIVWLQKALAYHKPLLKAEADVNGPVRYTDGNGKIYEYGPTPVPSTTYPLDRTTLHLLDEHSSTTGDDWVKWNLNISSTTIKPRLAAKKRNALREQFEASVIETGTKPKYAIRTPDGVEPEYNPYAEE